MSYIGCKTQQITVTKGMGDMMIVLAPDSETAVTEGIIASVERLPLLGFERMDDHYIEYRPDYNR